MKMNKVLMSVAGLAFASTVALAAETTTNAPAQGAATPANSGLTGEVKSMDKDAAKTTAQNETSAPKAKKGHKKAKKK